MMMTPEVSFTHTLSEISVNRADPCELVRELISNAYDANATLMRVYALTDKRGLLFFDNGAGLSRDDRDRRNDILPYVAFFSIGKGTKTRGVGIGYKCQGSKLCFASKRFSLITRTERDESWFAKVIDNPKENLKETSDLTPTSIDNPWEYLRTQLLPDADARTSKALETLGQDFFQSHFRHGTLLLIEDFETEDYEQYFSTAPVDQNYLYQYIRLHTAQGDSRRLTRQQGFRGADIVAVEKTRPDKTERKLELWIEERTSGKLVEIPQGWMYLDSKEDSFESSPSDVPQLRSGRFFSRHATTFKHGADYFSIILAIDGNRRALDRYTGLARRGGSNSGLKLSHTRGPLLSSRGIVVSNYPQLWNLPGLYESEFAILADGADHYTLIIDGPFDLVTNRDAPAPSAQQILRDAKFAQHIRKALTEFQNSKEGAVLAELLQRLNRETTRHKEDAYIDANARLRAELGHRETFTVKGVEPLKGRVLYAPLPGEEHFVGALYTLFSHLVAPASDTREFWSRPLTFASRGIDALAVLDDSKKLTNGNVQSLEYKYFFTTSDEFNHPMNITERIICWDFEAIEDGTQVRDSYNYLATVGDAITSTLTNGTERQVGFVLSGLRHANETREIDHKVEVLSLRRLLELTFDAKFTKPAPVPSSSKRTGVKRR